MRMRCRPATTSARQCWRWSSARCSRAVGNWWPTRGSWPSGVTTLSSRSLACRSCWCAGRTTCCAHSPTCAATVPARWRYATARAHASCTANTTAGPTRWRASCAARRKCRTPATSGSRTSACRRCACTNGRAWCSWRSIPKCRRSRRSTAASPSASRRSIWRRCVTCAARTTISTATGRSTSTTSWRATTCRTCTRACRGCSTIVPTTPNCSRGIRCSRRRCATAPTSTATVRRSTTSSTPT